MGTTPAMSHWNAEPITQALYHKVLALREWKTPTTPNNEAVELRIKGGENRNCWTTKGLKTIIQLKRSHVLSNILRRWTRSTVYTAHATQKGINRLKMYFYSDRNVFVLLLRQLLNGSTITIQKFTNTMGYICRIPLNITKQTLTIFIGFRSKGQ